MVRWTACPFAGEYPLDLARMRTLWEVLHAGDSEPLPADAAVQQAWLHYHRGELERAAQAGLAAGGDGITVANKAAAIYATLIERHEKTRLELLLQVAQRAEAQTEAQGLNPNAWYWHAYALGRYSQGVSVAKALAQGLGAKVRGSLERVIALQPRHADAHVALGTFHAEVIDKVGPLVGGLTYGARRDVGLQLLEQGLRLNPRSAVAMVECANGLLMLEGEARQAEAHSLYEQAAASEALDAIERMNVERARLELQDS